MTSNPGDVIVLAHADEVALVIWDLDGDLSVEYQRIIGWKFGEILEPIFLDWNVQGSESCLVFLSNSRESWTERSLGETVENTPAARKFAEAFFASRRDRKAKADHASHPHARAYTPLKPKL